MLGASGANGQNAINNVANINEDAALKYSDSINKIQAKNSEANADLLGVIGKGAVTGIAYGLTRKNTPPNAA